MNRREFMSELEYLLQDIPEEEKAEALAYYQDYLEDAGDENEEQVIREFGSPERVAAIIRSELSGNLEAGGEFTEAGYQDERFKDPNYQMVQHRNLPDVSETVAEGSDREAGNTSEKRRKQKPTDDSLLMRILKVGLLLLGIAVLSPLLFGFGGIVLGLGGGVLGLVAGAVGLLLTVVLLIGILTLVACIGAVALLVLGVALLFSNPWAGVMTLGLGVLVLGLAFIGIALSVLTYGKLIPFCIRSLVDAVSSLFHRGRRKRT